MANLTMMKLATLYGESNRPGYQGWVDLRDCSLSERMPIYQKDSSFYITKEIDRLSARLSHMCAIGTPIALITIRFVHEQTGRIVRQFVCNDVLLSGYAMSGSADGVPLERVDFTAATIR
jgi:type VI protein secretion system component Hcp